MNSYSALDRKKLAVIHIVKKELGLSDQEYRNILERVTGKRSAKELDERDFRGLMRFLARSRYYRLNAEGLTFRQKLYIRHLQADLGWDEVHFRNFLRKYYKKTELEAFSKKETSKLIESLKQVIRYRSEQG